ncbi:hypothetical protein HHI36_005707 [Cryptolaemus montrouzieri]|uniref:Uncharacterized protein n=1 Tax=Cryptolaemus montrouzieri TaxID=559131 RepID=A0ABD2NUX0_9CUCU
MSNPTQTDMNAETSMENRNYQKLLTALNKHIGTPISSTHRALYLISEEVVTKGTSGGTVHTGLVYENSAKKKHKQNLKMVDVMKDHTTAREKNHIFTSSWFSYAIENTQESIADQNYTENVDDTEKNLTIGRNSDLSNIKVETEEMETIDLDHL